MKSVLELLTNVNAAAMLEQELHLLDTIEVKYRLLVWESTPSIVLSSKDSRLPNARSAADHLATKGWPVVTRKTGGSAFPQGPGIINISLLLNSARTEQANNIDAGYELFCAFCQRALSLIGVDTQTGSVPASFCDGRFNITAGGRKLAGTSQRWSRRDDVTRKLFHCGLLFDADCIDLCEQINCFYALARSGQDSACDSVLAERHTSVKALNTTATRQHLLEGLEQALGEFDAKL